MEWLGWSRKGEFSKRIGITYEEVQSLDDELVIIRDRVLDIPPFVVPQTGEFVGRTEISKVGTDWDQLPKAEAELRHDGRVELILARGELAILANCVEVILQETAYMGPEGRDSELHSRIGMRVPEIEALRHELRRLDREARGDE